MCDRAGDKHEEEVPGCCGCVRFFHTIYAIYVTPAVLSSDGVGWANNAHGQKGYFFCRYYDSIA